jgi:hypothetical protein
MKLKQQQTYTYSPYCYLIGWKQQNKFYYGVRTSKKAKTLYESGCHPDDLWSLYFTSSEIVANFRKKYGEPDIIEVRRVFKTAAAAADWEIRVLRRMNAAKNKKWLNISNNLQGYNQTPETLLKMSRAQKGRKHSEETKEKIRKWNVGRKMAPISAAHKKAIKDANLGSKRSDESKAKISEALTGLTKSESHRAALSKSKTGKKNLKLMTGKNLPCMVCGEDIYHIQYKLKHGNIQKTCSKECKATLKNS